MHHDSNSGHRPEPENNPLGIGPRDREGSNTGSTEDTSYNAHGSDPYETGEPDKRSRPGPTPDPRLRDGADPDTTSSDEP